MTNNNRALAAFIAHNTDIAEMLKELSALCDDHFNIAPDDVTWANVGSLNAIRAQLNGIVRFAGAREAV